MTAKLSVAVMAHKRRAEFIPELLDRLELGDDAVVWDRVNDRWDTGRRAMLHFDPAATHHLVVQDDAVVPRDLIPGVERALDHIPAGTNDPTPMCLYLGNTTPHRYWVQKAAQLASEQQASWLRLELHWGVGIVMPTELIAPMVRWGDRNSQIANYDKRIGRWLRGEGIRTWYPWPSLVDHRDSPSLVAGRRSRGRCAHQFIGADASALDVDWSGPVIDGAALPAGRAPARRQPRPPEEATMAVPSDTVMIAAKHAMVPTGSGARRKIRRDVTTAHVDSEIVRDRPHLWRPLMVDYPAETDEVDDPPPPPAPEPEPEPEPEPAADPEPDETPEPTPEPKAKDVRAWAKEQGMDVPSSGKVPADIVQAYKEAQQGDGGGREW